MKPYEAIRSKIAGLEGHVLRLREELKDIQDACDHPNLPERDDSLEEYCDVCDECGFCSYNYVLHGTWDEPGTDLAEDEQE